MSSKIVKSCAISYFTQDQSSFFMKDIAVLLEDHPVLCEYFRASCYMLLLIREGEYGLSVNDFELEGHSSKVIVIKPGDIVKFNLIKDCKGSFVCFEESFFSLRYHENVLRFFDFFQTDSVPSQQLDSILSEKLSVLLALMNVEHSSGRVDREKVLRSYLNILLCELQSLTNEGSIENYKVVKSAVNHRILMFQDLVEQYFKEAKTPAFYAEKLCVTPNYLNKLCKQEKGVTAGQIVRQRIVIEAKRLLQFSTFNINEIARELCFDSTSYFVTFFKKQEGITPENYRKNFT